MPPLHPNGARDARDFLLPAPLFELRDGVATLDALLDGELGEDMSVVWRAEGGAVTPGPDGTAILKPSRDDWIVVATLMRREREVARAEARAPAARTVEVEQLVEMRRSSLPLRGDACDDVGFPGRMAEGHVGCSGGEAPAIDLFLPWGAEAPAAMPAMPRRVGQKDDPTIRPSHASLGAGLLAWTSRGLGTWNGPSGGAVHWLPDAGLLGGPAIGPRHLAVLRHDRVEVAGHGASQRSLLPAQPLDGPGSAGLAHPWLALLEGSAGASRLGLRQLKRNRVAWIGGTADRWDVHVDERWLTWQEGFDVCWLDLAQGELRRSALRAVRGRRSVRLDDLLLLPTIGRTGVELTALHLPSGEAATVYAPGGELRLRGAAAGGVTVAAGPFGEAPQLVALSPVRRLREEAAAGSPRSGGHGGEHRWLGEGQTSRFLDPGPGAVALAVWMPDDRGRGRVEAWRGGARLGEVELIEGAAAGWLDLGRAEAPPGLGEDQRVVEVRWTAGPGGIAVDALRLTAGAAP